MLSLLTLKNTVINDKKGYNITPIVNSLKDLKTLLNNMYSIRAASGTYCSGHSGTSYGGKISLKEMNSALASLKACNCNSRTANTTSCECNNRTACSCNGRTYSYCSCNYRTSSDGCLCNVDINYVCTCYNRTQSNPSMCTCESRTNTCNCKNRIQDYNCECNVEKDVDPNHLCNCELRTATSDSVYSSSSDCSGYVGASCPSRTTCACNTVNEFS